LAISISLEPLPNNVALACDAPTPGLAVKHPEEKAAHMARPASPDAITSRNGGGGGCLEESFISARALLRLAQYGQSETRGPLPTYSRALARPLSPAFLVSLPRGTLPKHYSPL